MTAGLRTRRAAKGAEWNSEERSRNSLGLGIAAGVLNLICPTFALMVIVMIRIDSYHPPELGDVLVGGLLVIIPSIGAAAGLVGGVVALSRIRRTSPRAFTAWVLVWLGWLTLLLWGGFAVMVDIQ